MRNGFWQFVYDWQTLAAGLLALLAAIITGAILWGQLKSAARQAAAAERQAFLAITDALKRQLLSIDDLKTEIGKLDNSIGSIELFKASQEDMDKLREVKSGIVDRLYDIRRNALTNGMGPSSKANGPINHFCDLARRWAIAAGKIEKKQREQPADAILHERELNELFKEAYAIREQLLRADLDAQQAINDETAHVRQREAELRTLVWEPPPRR